MLNFQIETNIYRDKQTFKKFLLDQEYIEKRGHVKKKIFLMYPQLAENLSPKDLTQQEKEQIVDDFIESIYTQNQQRINEKLNKWKELFHKNSENITEGFRQTMNYRTTETTVYIYPSFLPSSTFGEDYVCFSLMKSNPPYLDLFLHEYSHIIWNQQTKEFYQKYGELDKISHDYLKEIVAPVIIRDKIWDNIRQAEFHKYANTRQQLLNIKYQGKNYNIVDFFESIYIEDKKKDKSFLKTAGEYIKIFHKISDQIKEKHKIYSNLENPEDKEEMEEKGFLSPVILQDNKN